MTSGSSLTAWIERLGPTLQGQRSVFDDTPCQLGEGPLWHPLRQELIWFDILSKKMFCKAEDTALQSFDFAHHMSAAGWVDHERLVLASETGLHLFDLRAEVLSLLLPLEADNPVTRSNDGRADPWGGFWIGTMGKQAEPQAGAIYRYYRGELRKLVDRQTITNAICFAPDRSCAYFTDTADGRIMRQALHPDHGWPVDQPEMFIDFQEAPFGPDGAVTDAAGSIWVALWGAGCVAGFSPKGDALGHVQLPIRNSTCPSFAGADFATMLITSATDEDSTEFAGHTFSISMDVAGRAEPSVTIG